MGDRNAKMSLPAAVQDAQDNFEAKIAGLEDAADLAEYTAEYAIPDDAIFDGALATMGAQFAAKAASIAMIAPDGIPVPSGIPNVLQTTLHEGHLHPYDHFHCSLPLIATVIVPRHAT